MADRIGDGHGAARGLAWEGTGQCSEPDRGVTGLGSELYTQLDCVELHSRQTLKSKFSNVKETTRPKGHIS